MRGRNLASGVVAGVPMSGIASTRHGERMAVPARDGLRGMCPVVALTRSEHGSVILTPKDTITVPAGSDLKVVDTTGAGDLYAAGFLYGYTQEQPLEACAKLGTKCASYIIQQIGARPAKPLNALI